MQELEAERRALHNAVVDLRGSVRVLCRVRPELPHEAAQDRKLALKCNTLAGSIELLSERCACLSCASAARVL